MVFIFLKNLALVLPGQLHPWLFFFFFPPGLPLTGWELSSVVLISFPVLEVLAGSPSLECLRQAGDV